MIKIKVKFSEIDLLFPPKCVGCGTQENLEKTKKKFIHSYTTPLLFIQMKSRHVEFQKSFFLCKDCTDKAKSIIEKRQNYFMLAFISIWLLLFILILNSNDLDPKQTAEAIVGLIFGIPFFGCLLFYPNDNYIDIYLKSKFNKSTNEIIYYELKSEKARTKILKDLEKVT